MLAGVGDGDGSRLQVDVLLPKECGLVHPQAAERLQTRQWIEARIVSLEPGQHDVDLLSVQAFDLVLRWSLQFDLRQRLHELGRYL